MPRSIYDMLGIEPTNDLSVVTKAYHKKALELHPDKSILREDSNEKKLEKTSLFAQLSGAFEQVNDQEKLNRYFESGIYRADGQSSASTATSAAAEDVEEEEPTIARFGFISIFIPISVFEAAEKSKDGGYLKFEKSRKGKNINFQHVAESLSELCRDRHVQVGLNCQEAADIYHQHSIYYNHVAVKVSVPIASTSASKRSEAQMYPGVRNAGREAYFLLKKGTQFVASDILSIHAIHHYTSCASNRISSRLTDIDDLLPQFASDGMAFIDNPHHSSITTSAPPIAFFERQEALPAVAMTERVTANTNATFTQEDKEAISFEIDKLVNELVEKQESFFKKSQCPKIKHKIEGLHKLLSLMEDKKSKIDAITTIESEFPELKEGSTAKLLKQLKSSEPPVFNKPTPPFNK